MLALCLFLGPTQLSVACNAMHKSGRGSGIIIDKKSREKDDSIQLSVVIDHQCAYIHSLINNINSVLPLSLPIQAIEA